jgi:hypothetical protein
MGFIGGVSLGYVCLYMLPKFSGGVQNIGLLYPDSNTLFRNFVYYILLGSILFFLTLENARVHHRTGLIAAKWLHISSHGLYCILIGYIAVELPLPTLEMHVLANVILAIHLLGMVLHLKEHYPEVYNGRTRWLFSFLVITGYLLGIVTQLPIMVIVTVTSFVSGFILVNVISDELPRHGKGGLQWFLIGTGLFVISIIPLHPG